MSTINITKFPGESASLEAVVRAHTADFEAIAEYARSVGCLHHRIVARSHELVVIDEWENIGEAVTKFWGLPEGNALFREAGVGPPIDWGNYRPIWDPTEF
jgi:hypothetical protein